MVCIEGLFFDLILDFLKSLEYPIWIRSTSWIKKKLKPFKVCTVKSGESCCSTSATQFSESRIEFLLGFTITISQSFRFPKNGGTPLKIYESNALRWMVTRCRQRNFPSLWPRASTTRCQCRNPYANGGYSTRLKLLPLKEPRTNRTNRTNAVQPQTLTRRKTRTPWLSTLHGVWGNVTKSLISSGPPMFYETLPL